MKKQEQIDALRFRIEQIESHLAEQHRGANFSKLNKPEALECVANKWVSENMVKPDFIPDWKDAPEDAVCVAMDEDGEWSWWTHTPIAFKHNMAGWIWGVMGATNRLALEAGTCTNAHLLPPDYWKSTLMMRPDAVAGDWSTAPDWATHKAMDADGNWNWFSSQPYTPVSEWMLREDIDKYKLIPNHPSTDKDWTETLEERPESKQPEIIHYEYELDLIQPPLEEKLHEPNYTHLLPEGYEFCQEGEHEKFVKVELFGGVNEAPVGFTSDYNIFIGTYLPIRKSAPDYSPFLPEGYEFCEEADAEKWVKVEKLGIEGERPLGAFENKHILEGHKPYYRPIRPIQYKVTTHEIVTSIPDPYIPDWSKAPEGTVAHAWDKNGNGHWYHASVNGNVWFYCHRKSYLTLPPDLDWKQSLRVKPSK